MSNVTLKFNVIKNLITGECKVRAKGEAVVLNEKVVASKQVTLNIPHTVVGYVYDTGSGFDPFFLTAVDPSVAPKDWKLIKKVEIGL